MWWLLLIPAAGVVLWGSKKIAESFLPPDPNKKV